MHESTKMAAGREYVEREAVLAKAALVAGCFSNMVSAYDIAAIPAADVVEVVRCKDCKHYYVDEYYGATTCDRCCIDEPDSSDFCSYGERKDGEG